MTGTVIAQANHYLTPWFQRNNANLREPDDEDSQSFLDSSTSRLKALQRRMAELPSNFTLTDALNLLVIPPVSNDETCQRMAFCPGTGEVIVRINDGHNRFQDSQFIYRESNRT